MKPVVLVDVDAVPVRCALPVLQEPSANRPSSEFAGGIALLQRSGQVPRLTLLRRPDHNLNEAGFEERAGAHFAIRTSRNTGTFPHAQ